MSTYSPDLRITLITTGDQAGTWGTTTNTNLGTIIEDAISGFVTVSVVSANQAFTAVNGAADEARSAMIRLTTTTVAPFNVYAPPVSKQYIIWNNSGQTATIFNSTVIGNTTAAGAGVSIANGDRVVVFSNGTNFYDTKSGNITGTVAIANGGTGQTTANAAFNALAPNQSGQAGRYLKTDGTNASWDAIDLSTADISGTLPLTNGGTGATTASGARSSLGLGTMATQDASNVAITGGSITGITDLAVADGGTGASTAAGARTNLSVPSTTGSGASGTWSIDISGNAATATSAATVTTTIASGATATTQPFGTGNTTVATTAFVQAALQFLYPVGTVYINASNSNNPATFFGFGTWVLYSSGRVLVGIDTGNPLFDSLEETGGSADAVVVSHTHTATTTITDPGHDHAVYPNLYGAFLGDGPFIHPATTFTGGNNANTGSRTTGITAATTVASTGSSGTNANYQPYITVYMWKRTA